jgi:hypothetical protein
LKCSTTLGLDDKRAQERRRKKREEEIAERDRRAREAAKRQRDLAAKRKHEKAAAEAAMAAAHAKAEEEVAAKAQQDAALAAAREKAEQEAALAADRARAEQEAAAAAARARAEQEAAAAAARAKAANEAAALEKAEKEAAVARDKAQQEAAAASARAEQEATALSIVAGSVELEKDENFSLGKAKSRSNLENAVKRGSGKAKAKKAKKTTRGSAVETVKVPGRKQLRASRTPKVASLGPQEQSPEKLPAGKAETGSAQKRKSSELGIGFSGALSAMLFEQIQSPMKRMKDESDSLPPLLGTEPWDRSEEIEAALEEEINLFFDQDENETPAEPLQLN